MIGFTQWLEGQQDTASMFKNLLQNVPQDPTHHPEGSVARHSKMVRGSIHKAIGALKMMDMPILSNLDFNDISPKELEVLTMAAWLHDIGKHSATEIEKTAGLGWNKPDKITSYGHQDSSHFMPQIEKFKDIATPETKELYTQNKELIDFLIAHHMDFMSRTGFSKSFRGEWLDENGKLKNNPKIKLLLVLMMADKMGRGVKPGENQQDVSQKAIGFTQNSLKTTYDKALERMKRIASHTSQPYQGDMESFIDMLKSRGLPDNTIKSSVKKKFGVDI